jgi:hypothetical protein
MLHAGDKNCVALCSWYTTQLNKTRGARPFAPEKTSLIAPHVLTRGGGGGREQKTVCLFVPKEREREHKT